MNNDVCTYIRYDRVSLNIFKDYLSALTTLVEHNISLAPPDRFVLVFDRQTTPEEHYVALLATFTSKKMLDIAVHVRQCCH